jgi:hypothetical protein
MNSWTLNDKIKDEKEIKKKNKGYCEVDVTIRDKKKLEAATKVKTLSNEDIQKRLSEYNQYDLITNNEYYMTDAEKIQWAPFLFLNDHVNKYDKIAKEVMASDNSEIYDKLREAFHSNENIEIIQKELIMYVYKVTKGTFLIEKQNKASLLTVMEYIYLYYGRNLPINIKEQIREMNKKTVGLAAQSIITHCQQYMGYLRDINKRPINILPINPSKKGTKTLDVTKYL